MSSSSGALFPSAVASSRGAASKYLVEFRAGKMSLRGGTVTPDSRKGLVFVHQSEDALLHLCWRDRTTGQLEEDLIIFPDDCEFKRVPQCTTGRVFVLKFKAGSRRLFFWMQEPKTDKDDELCKKVNDLLNNPPVPGSVGSGSSSHGLSSDLAALGGEGGLQSLLGNMDQQQLMQLMGASGLGGLGGLGALAGLLGSGHSSGSRGQVGSLARSVSSARAAAASASSASASSSSAATTTTTTTTAVLAAETPPSVTPVPPVTPVPTAATATPVPATAPTMLPAVPTAVPTQPIQLSDLQSILTSMNVPTSPGATATQPALDLAAVLTPDIMAPILANPEVQQRLLPFLPVGEALPLSPDEIQSTMSSPQFQQAMSMFTAALGSGQLGPLMSQFGLPDEAVQAAGHGDVEGFARAMQGRPGGADTGTTEGAPSGDVEPSGDKKDEEEDMSLD